MNELSLNQKSGSLVPEYENPHDEAFAQVSGSQFLPRVQLFISNSDAVKSEKIAMNHYGFVTGKDQIEDLGKEVDMLLIAWRPRALDTNDRQNIRSSCNISSELFKEIKEKSAIKNSGCQYGPEYLIWVPQKEAYATFFLGSATGRNEATKVHHFLREPCTFKSRPIKNPQYSWQGPAVFPCSTPFDPPPDQEKTLELIQTFLHAPDQTGAEKVEETVQQRDR